MKRRPAILVSLAAATLVAVPSAAYAEISASTSGSYAYTSNNFTRANANDTVCDGTNRIAYANWNNLSGNRVQAYGGCGTTASATVSSITSIRACVDVKDNPDPCSNWSYRP